MKNKTVCWVIIGCLAIACVVTGLVVWKVVWKHSPRVQTGVPGPAGPAAKRPARSLSALRG